MKRTVTCLVGASLLGLVVAPDAWAQGEAGTGDSAASPVAPAGPASPHAEAPAEPASEAAPSAQPPAPAPPSLGQLVDPPGAGGPAATESAAAPSAESEVQPALAGPSASVPREENPYADPLPTGGAPAESSADGAETSWLSGLDYRVFADGYFAVDYRAPKPMLGPRDDVRAYDQAAGFSLAWAGADLGVEPDSVGGRLSLRWGPAAERYADSCVSAYEPCDSELGLSFLKQAYASWRPGQGSVRLDFGKFDTIYGAELAESQDNINYTRGVLYWLGQPLFHTGLRAAWEADRRLTLTAMVVNGWNNTVDNNAGKSFGVQFSYRVPQSDSPEDTLLSLSLGYLVGPEQDDVERVLCPAGQTLDPAQGCVADPSSDGGVFLRDGADADTKGLRHLIDGVLAVNPTKGLQLVANADLAMERVRDRVRPGEFRSVTWWGAMLGARVAFTESIGLGLRGELFRDLDGAVLPQTEPFGVDLASGTLTLDVAPSPNLLLRLDNRLDWAEYQIFQSSVRDTVGTQLTSTLGVVVTTD